MPSPPTTLSDAALIGRAGEQDLLLVALEQTTAGAGSSLALVGPAGSGKTALLDWLVSEARRRGTQVLRVSGAEDEADLAWAGLSTLCLPRLDLLDRLPGPQGRALRTALALLDADAPIDRLAVSLAALGVLSAAGREAPLVVIVDDVQWIDEETRRAVDFLARRLGDDPVLLVTASRPGRPPVGSTTIALAGLGDAEIGVLLARQGVRAEAARAAIVALAVGNPLLARQLAAGLRPEERSGARPVPATLRVPAEVEELYRPALDRLGPDAAQALTVAAADSSGDAATIAAALQRLGLGLADLEPAEAAGLVSLDGGRVRFSHPLARSAAYHGSPAPPRRRAHLALAEAEGFERGRGVLHRVAAAVGPDPELVRALDELATDAARRGAPIAAASRWVEAAGLAAAGDERCTLLVRAARAALAAGEARWASQLLVDARRADGPRAGHLDARRVEVRLAVAAGDLGRAQALAEEADDQFGATDPVGVAELLGEAVRPMLSQTPFAAPALTERIWELAGAAEGVDRLYAEVLYGLGRFIQGDDDGAARHVATWTELLRREGAVVAGSFLAETVVPYLSYSNQKAAAARLLAEVEAKVRANCSVGALVPVLGARALMAYGIDLQDCMAAGREALELSAETGQPGLGQLGRNAVVLAAAVAGDEALATQVSEVLLAQGDVSSETSARAALGRLHLVAGRAEAAVDQFALLRGRIGGENLSFIQFEADEAEALVRVGRVDDARKALPLLGERARSGAPWSVAMFEKVRGLVAEDVDEAASHFDAAAQALATSDNRVAQGVIELLWGERLRRSKRRAEARRHLERAVELFGRVGAAGSRRQAEAELAAAGGASDRSRPTAELLGPMELQVARLAAAGGTNRDIANQIFVSPRTVENHLGAVYRKLGIAGRPGLVARAASDESLRLRAGGGG
ncbi:MAG: transcriptional regulator, LuxR family [Acidimicrobiales bacterium]|nr:transcriptional regulator, LuxR family [Acidimicrobiales bacterium]